MEIGVRPRSQLRDVSELPAIEVVHRLNDLFAGIHHEWSVTHDRLVDGLSREQQDLGVAI